jgi:hypothetical protein
MPSYLIIGCGRFGSRAVQRLLCKHPRSKITVVDKNEEAFQEISNLPAQKVVCDGLLYLDQALSDGSADYVIPAVPFHLAFEFILLRLKPFGAKRMTAPHLRGLPNLMLGRTRDLYISFADFLCPEDCPEPLKFCTVTGKERARSLFKILQQLEGPFDSLGIRSHQLGPGVGGYRPGELLDLIETIKKRRNSNRPFLISTACRCHGVISALSI